MNTQKNFLMLLVLSSVLFAATFAVAADFDWTKELNVKAVEDPAGFRAELSSRFKIGDAQVKVVLGNVGKPGDAYMVLRLVEMSSKPVDYVLNKYKSEKSKGWGALAKSLGIKPGSREFHALKQGRDVYGHDYKNKGKKVKSGKGKG